MSEDQTNGSSHRSWLERLGHALAGEPQDQEQLIELLRDAERRNLLDPDALVMIEGVLQVAEQQVRDIMIPRAQMAVVSLNDPLEETLSTIVRTGHSRFPVVGDHRDQVEGTLLAKDLLRLFSEKTEARFAVRDVLRPAVFIPESKRLNVLLKEFRGNRNHMAIVVDEYGGVSGLVTIEDVIEQIVGEIEDEHDIEEEHPIIDLGRGRYAVKALTPIDEFNEQFGTAFSDEDYDTIGGLILTELGRLPKRGEALEVAGLRFQVMRADNRRIHLVHVDRLPEAVLAGDDRNHTAGPA